MKQLTEKPFTENWSRFMSLHHGSQDYLRCINRLYMSGEQVRYQYSRPLITSAFDFVTIKLNDSLTYEQESYTGRKVNCRMGV